MNKEITIVGTIVPAPKALKKFKNNFPPKIKQSGMSKTMIKQVKHMHKWKHVLLLGAGILFCASSFAQETYSATLEWDEVLHATHYLVQEEINGTFEDVTESPSSAATYSVVARAAGTYKFRVGGCVQEPNVTIHCGENVAQWSEPYTLTLPLAGTNQRRVIFIHTDLLGSPAAETDEDGEVQ